MRETQQHTVAQSFARGVQSGRKEVHDGDFTDAAVGLVMILVITSVCAVVVFKIVRWLTNW